MARPRPVLRDAVADDAAALLLIWTDFTSDPPRQPRPSADLDGVRRSCATIADDPLQRLVVAVADGQPVGVAHLRLGPVSPIHGEDAVHVGYLHVLSDYRRRGIGRQLMEAAADWAQESGTNNIVASVAATARDSNRFLARLGMSQVAVLRATTVCALRGKLRPPTALQVPNVVAARRLRRLSASREPAGR